MRLFTVRLALSALPRSSRSPLVGGSANAQSSLSPTERAIVRAVDSHRDESLALLERLVNINSGTMNFAGVRQVGDALRPQFDALGLHDALGRRSRIPSRGPSRRGTSRDRARRSCSSGTSTPSSNRLEPVSDVRAAERLDGARARRDRHEGRRRDSSLRAARAGRRRHARQDERDRRVRRRRGGSRDAGRRRAARARATRRPARATRSASRTARGIPRRPSSRAAAPARGRCGPPALRRTRRRSSSRRSAPAPCTKRREFSPSSTRGCRRKRTSRSTRVSPSAARS